MSGACTDEEDEQGRVVLWVLRLFIADLAWGENRLKGKCFKIFVRVKHLT